METMNEKNILESILFAAGEPVSLTVLANAVEATPGQTKKILEELKNELDYAMRGIRIIQMDTQYQMTSRGEYFDYIKNVMTHYTSSRLSQAALETLAIVAYRQPVTRAEIEQIRGVQTTSSLNLLVDRGLIEIAGKLDVPGKPLSYATTHEFLKLLNIEKINQLPEYEEFAQGIQLALEEEQQLQ